MLRSITERLARRIVFQRRLPPAFGRRPLYVTPDSALGYLKPGFAGFSDLIEMAAGYVTEGDCVWDIGANVGLFSLLAAHRAGEGGSVVSVEADPVLAALIQKTVSLPRNADRMINVLCAAVSDRTGISEFRIAARGRSSSHLQVARHRSQTGGTRYTHFVPTTTLDDMQAVFLPPTFIKIDVEGAELLVLQGGLRLLEETRPTIYIEVSDKESASVSELLLSFGYQLFDGTQPIVGQKAGQRCVFNTLAIPPRERQHQADAA
ncbi:MAG: FkbM family methyltransferase [Fuerstiella sp.]